MENELVKIVEDTLFRMEDIVESEGEGSGPVLIDVMDLRIVMSYVKVLEQYILEKEKENGRPT